VGKKKHANKQADFFVIYNFIKSKLVPTRCNGHRKRYKKRKFRLRSGGGESRVEKNREQQYRNQNKIEPKRNGTKKIIKTKKGKRFGDWAALQLYAPRGENKLKIILTTAIERFKASISIIFALSSPNRIKNRNYTYIAYT